jgi:WD40 repeat protein
MSYGKCLLYGVGMDTVGGVTQASLVPFGLKFQSGIMRGRFHPKDGQLYLAGLKGWQNAATRDGGFYRVRYTGKPVHTALKAHAARNGLQLSFSTPLKPEAAADVANYSVELWNYRYSGGYGSPELSVKTGKDGHDKLEVKSATLSPDGRSVFLAIDGLTKADQYSVKYTLNAADGTEVRSEIIGTIHRLGPAITAAAR